MKNIWEWFSGRQLRVKILLTYIVSIIIIVSVGYAYYISSSIATYQLEAYKYSQHLIEEKKEFVKNTADVATKSAQAFYNDYKNGQMSEAEAQIKAVEHIDAIRYSVEHSNSEYGYVWINTIDGTIVSDPAEPKLNGTDVLNLKDKNGVYLFREMANVVKTSGSGFVHYCWAKPGQPKSECFSKISYVDYFSPWKWVIGSGFYIDDVNKYVSNYILRTKHNLIKMVLYSVMLGIFVTAISSIVFFLMLSKITSYISKMADLSKKLTTERISPELKLPIVFNDELSDLVRNFNVFIDETYKLFLFKKTIEGDKDMDAVYKRLVHLLKEEFSFDSFTIYEVNNSQNALKQIETAGSDDIFCKHDILIDSNLCRAFRTAHDIDSFEEKNVCLSYKGQLNKNHICIPVVFGGTTGAIIQIIFDEDADSGEARREVKRLKRFLRESAPVMESKRLLSQLKESTLRDPLTGLYNRRFLDEFASTFVASTERRGTQSGILMCDIDFFKKVNDTYGHNAGDEVLKSVTKAMMKGTRESDMFVRFGGEEFLILLADIEKEGEAMEIAERIRKYVESTDINIGGGVIKKTISIGISIFDNDSKNFWQCVKYSDVAMYKAKETGRNKTVRFEPSMWESEDY